MCTYLVSLLDLFVSLFVHKLNRFTDFNSLFETGLTLGFVCLFVCLFTSSQVSQISIHSLKLVSLLDFILSHFKVVELSEFSFFWSELHLNFEICSP